MEHNLQTADSTDSPPPAKRRRTELGFKELAPGMHPGVDIVAIHGIDGDRDGSWTAENGVFWLRDLLPAEIPNARILTYGYDANTHGQMRLATDFMHDHAMNFVSKLALLREISATVDRAIIFVAHSFGGLLLKCALIHSHLCNESHLKNHRTISRATYAVTFFGTPHLGSATAELARSIVDTSFSTPISTVLLRHLERDSEALQHQLMQYSAISSQFETKFFYEIYDTHFAGVSRRMVPRTSAVVPGALNAEAIGIHKDHAHMVKFASVEDEDFRTVSSVLSVISKAACERMAEKEDRYKSPIEFGSCPTLESGVRIVTENVAKVVLDVKAVTGDMAKIGQGINSLVRDGLPRAIEARFDMDNRQRCLEGTRVDLLDTISRWAMQNDFMDSKTSAFIFWLCGQAGTGKTTICSSVADACHAHGLLGASFFFSRDREDRNNIRLVFPTISHQLGTFCKEFGELVTEIFRNDRDLVYSDPGSQLEKLIINPLNACASFPSGAIVVIDALDECKDEAPISTILTILSNNRRRLPLLKFFITSRPEENIHLGFEPLQDITQSLILHDIDASLVDADIGRYLRQGLASASRIYRHRSSRLFIFAATAIKFILDRSCRNPIRQVEVLLEGSQKIESSSSPFYYLDQLYLKVLRQAFPETTTSSCFDLLKMIIGAVVLLRNPLSPGDLESLLGLDDGVIRDTLSCLHSIIVVPDTDDHPIRLIHPSFFDFATARCSDLQFRVNSTFHHEQLAMLCFKQMTRLTRDICKIMDASKLNEEIGDLPERIEEYLPPALRYACLHWAFHMCGAPKSPSLQTSLNEFCHKNLLYWIEALSLLGPVSLRDGIRHLQALQTHFTNHPSLPNELLTLLKDTQAFITEYFELISSASLQLYRTALPLSPPSNTVQKAFSHELGGGVRVMQRAGGRNYPGVTILRGHSNHVRSAEFSPDGTLVVSSSHDEVRLWDRGTGTQSRILKIDSSIIIWVKFFPDGKRIISGSNKGSIYIWDITSGACLKNIQLDGEYKLISHYTCSPDVTRIVGSARCDVMIWDVSNEYVLKTLRGHQKDVNSLAFSPNHMFIASGSNDDTIQLWDAVSGAALITFTGHYNAVTVIAFSPCSEYLVSGSWDHDLRLWDISRGITSIIFEGHSFCLCSVSFSQDGSQIISGSVDGELRVWNAVEGRLLKSLGLGNDEAVENVGISFDASNYICTLGNSIYIWDADRASGLDQSGKQFRKFKFSPDGTLLTALGNGALNLLDVHIWDGFTGVLKVVYGLPDSILSLKFSPNNQYLACVSVSYIRLLYLSTSTPLRTLKGHLQRILSVAFSSDSTRIVSTSRDETLRIWDITSGDNIFTVEASHDSAYFSPDGSQIIADTHHHYNIPPHIRSHLVPLNVPVVEQPQYSIAGEWVFASRGNKKERCIWLPVDWRNENAVSSRGRVAIGTRYGLVLLDLSDVNLST